MTDSSDTGRSVSPSIERIRRLERLEIERVEERDRKERARQELIAANKPSGGRHDLTDRIERLTRYPMFVAGLAWMVFGIIILTTNATRNTSATLVATLFAVWALMAIEYMVRLVVCPDRLGYIRRRWAEPITVVLPVFQGWHFIGMEKMSLLLREGQLRIASILRHHGLFRVLIAATGTLFIGSWLVLLFEENAPNSNIHSYPDALWWAIVTVTTVGYGDHFPVTAGGRAVAVVLMLLGIGLIGILTATVASVFMKEHTDANKEELRRGHRDLNQQLAVISARLADLEQRMGATPEQLATVDATASGDDSSNVEGSTP